MKSVPTNPLCSSCVHRTPLGYTHHSACSGGINGLVRAVAAGKAPKFNPHGAAHGWASWPFDFDPVWLEECELYENKVVEIASTDAGHKVARLISSTPGCDFYVSDFIPAGAAYADPPVPFGQGLKGISARRVEEEIAKALLEKKTGEAN